jgi:hypothetical protein
MTNIEDYPVLKDMKMFLGNCIDFHQKYTLTSLLN